VDAPRESGRRSATRGLFGRVVQRLEHLDLGLVADARAQRGEFLPRAMSRSDWRNCLTSAAPAVASSGSFTAVKATTRRPPLASCTSV